MKLKSPDYRAVSAEEAVSDFLSRIQQYEKRYETIDDKTERIYSFIKIFNCGERFLVHKIGGKNFDQFNLKSIASFFQVIFKVVLFIFS